MPIILNVVLGVPQMLSNIQMILICVAVSSTAHPLNVYGSARSHPTSPHRPMSCPRLACASSRLRVDCSPAHLATYVKTASRTSACCYTRMASSASSNRSAPCPCSSSLCHRHLLFGLRSRRSFWYLQVNGVPFSSLAGKFGNYPAALTQDLLFEAQSVYFFTLVVMQWGYASYVSHKNGTI